VANGKNPQSEKFALILVSNLILFEIRNGPILEEARGKLIMKKPEAKNSVTLSL
jgi:hypothetical protein